MASLWDRKMLSRRDPREVSFSPCQLLLLCVCVCVCVSVCVLMIMHGSDSFAGSQFLLCRKRGGLDTGHSDSLPVSDLTSGSPALILPVVLPNV